MLICFFLALVCVPTNKSFAQLQTYSIPDNPNKTDRNGLRHGAWTVLYDRNGNEVQNLNQAEYYSLMQYKMGKPSGSVVRYFKDGQKNREGVVIAEKPLVFEGLVTYYSHAGNAVQYQYFENRAVDHTKTLEYQEALVADLENNLGQKNADFLDALHFLAKSYEQAGRTEDADFAFKRSLSIRQQNHNTEDATYVESLFELAYFYEKAGRYTEATLYYWQYGKAKKEILGEKNPKYADFLQHLGFFFAYVARQPEQAVKCYEEALTIREKFYGKNDPNYFRSLAQYAEVLVQARQYKQAEDAFENLISEVRGIRSQTDPEYLSALNSLGKLYDLTQRYDEAENLYERVLSLQEHWIGEVPTPEFAETLNNLGHLYEKTGRYAEAEPVFKRAIEIEKADMGEKHPEYADALENLAELYEIMGNYAKTEPLYKQVIDIREEVLGQDDSTYLHTLDRLAAIYEKTGRYVEAEPIFVKVANARKVVLGDQHALYAESLDRLAFFYQRTERFGEAEKYFKESIVIKKTVLGERSTEYAIELLHLAQFYNVSERYTSSLPLYKQALSILKSNLGELHPDYIKYLNTQASIYDKIGNYKEAEPIFRQVMTIADITAGKRHPVYEEAVNNLARMMRNKNDINETYKLFLEANLLQQQQVRTVYPFLNEEEKLAFYQKIRTEWEHFNSFAVETSAYKPMILRTLYENLFVAKNFMFQQSDRLTENILNSKQYELINSYKHWQKLKTDLTRNYAKTKSELREGNINLEETEKALANIEGEISAKSPLFAKVYAQSKTYSWTDVRQKLKDGEAAIEIVRFRKYGMAKTISDITANGLTEYPIKGLTDSIAYAALIITPETKENPKIVILKNGNELEGKYLTTYRNGVKQRAEDRTSYQQFWQPIWEGLASVGDKHATKGGIIRKIYFAPDGVYNYLNLMALRNPRSNKYLLDELDIQTLTSTLELVVPKAQDNPNNTAVFFGNPTFEMPAKERESFARKNNLLSNKTLQAVSAEIPKNTSFAKIPHTGREIMAVGQVLAPRKWQISRYMMNEAVEEYLKAVYHPKVLHLATHGYFEPNAETDKQQNPLLRSGLILAGVRNTPNTPPASDENLLDDGVLTAKEALNLNLDSTDLVILSTCETGLGETKNEENLFNLQKAFRQAGAKALLMSMWRVNEQISQEFVQRFYQNWVSQKNRRAAFLKTQQDLKDKYKEPYIWAAFVMIGE